MNTSASRCESTSPIVKFDEGPRRCVKPCGHAGKHVAPTSGGQRVDSQYDYEIEWCKHGVDGFCRDCELSESAAVADAYRIEADCAMRDYDGLELDFGIARRALEQIAAGRPNRTFDPWARDLARSALAEVKHD